MYTAWVSSTESKSELKRFSGKVRSACSGKLVWPCQTLLRHFNYWRDRGESQRYYSSIEALVHICSFALGKILLGSVPWIRKREGEAGTLILTAKAARSGRPIQVQHRCLMEATSRRKDHVVTIHHSFWDELRYLESWRSVLVLWSWWLVLDLPSSKEAHANSFWTKPMQCKTSSFWWGLRLPVYG